MIADWRACELRVLSTSLWSEVTYTVQEVQSEMEASSLQTHPKSLKSSCISTIQGNRQVANRNAIVGICRQVPGTGSALARLWRRAGLFRLGRNAPAFWRRLNRPAKQITECDAVILGSHMDPTVTFASNGFGTVLAASSPIFGNP